MSQGFSFKEATAPVAPASSGGFSFEDAISVKQPKLAAEPETPSFPVGTMGGFEEAIAPIDRRSILDRPVPMPPAPPQDELLGINPQMVRAIKAQLDAAPPEKRQAMIAKLQNRGGVYGRIASSIASQYETIDRLPEKYRFVPQDFRSEVQAARFMAREGMTPEGAQSAAISQALIQAPLELTQATPLTEAQAAGERFKFEPGMAPIEETLLAIGRVGAKGGAAILQGTGGVIRFLGDAAGMDTRDTTKTLNTLNTFTQSMGEAKYKPLQIIEDAGTSIVQQLPALVGGAITGSQPLVLGSMFITSFGQTYDDSRRRKLDIGDATARAAMFAALEVVGEKFGLGDVLKGIKASAQGKPTGELANYFARALAKEVPGEQLTYAGQFAVDKGFGLNPEAGLAEFFKGAADTLAVTLAQGGMMMGGGAAISKASQKINQIVGRPPEQSFDYEALAKAKGFLAEQAPPPERPPAAPAVEPPAPAPIVTEAAPPVQPPRTTRRVEEEEFETLPPTEVPETPPEEPVAAQPMEPPAVERTPASFAADIAAGKKLETPEDIQFYRNNAKEIEDEFIKLTAKVPPTKPIKDKEEPVDQHGVSGLDIIEVPINQLTLSKDVPQFKLGATDKGIVEPLGGKFERTGVAPIQVWRRTDGSLEIISGRHRFDLAKRSGETTIPAQIHDEAQGFDKIQAATLDAELNIRDGQGKVKDYVNYFKESGIDRDEAESKGLLARAIGKRSFTIANQGSEELIAAVRGDQVGDEAAYYIALNAPNDSRLQNVGIQAVMDGKSMNVAVNTMQAVKALASENDTTTDMFGFDDSAIKEAEAMARIASQKQREIQTRLSAISGAAKNPAVAKAEGIDIRNPEQVNRRIEELRAKKAAWDNWSTNPTLIAEIRAARGVEAPALAPREEPVLTTQTKEELQEKERREREIEERKRQEELEARRKEEADKEREGFVLTGSDREADEAAARGQQDIFGAAPEPKNAPDENDPGFIGASDKEVEDVARAFDRAKEAQEDEGVTRVFDAPKKADVVRIEDKARIYVADAGYLTVEQAKQRIEEWKKRAESQGDNRANSEKIVLSLFDMTGEWSKPWEEAGYQVYRFDIQTDPEMGDVNKFSAEFFNDLYGAFEGQDVYAVLAACPCTDFASSGARHFAAKDADGRTVESVELVHQTLRTVEYFKPSVWAIENPVGRIEKLTGLPPWRMSFNPNHFGDPYTKKTLLWGRFNADLPIAPVEPTEGSKMHRMYGGKSQATKNARSVTPEGFAYAFFMANNAIDNPVMALANKYDMMDRAVFKAALDAGLSEKQITDIVNDPYYFSQDYKQAEADLRSAIDTAAAPAPAPAPEAKTLPSFSKSVDESAFDFGDEKVVKEIVKRSPLDSKALSKASELPGAVKKLPAGRSPELAAAAQQVLEGRMSKAEFDTLVNKYRPIHLFAAVPAPATDERVVFALSSDKKPYTNPEIDPGTEVGLRLDIPAFNRHSVMVVAIHEKRTPSRVGTSIGYASAAVIRNVTFGLGNQKETLKIAAGKAKDALQTMEGKYVESTPSETYELAKEVFSNPQWIQIGFDPVRHSYFWDRRTTMPVVKADVVIQIGNFILAKNPTYATKEEFLFDIASPPTKIYQPGAEVRKATRLERIQILANLRAARTRLVKKVIAGEATIDTQRQLTALESLGKDIKQMLDMTKEPSITPGAFLSRALKAYDDGDISADVLAVIQAAYIKQPELLNGLRLSVRKPGERETGAAGTFQTMARIVTLFKGTGGVELPGTIRHELSHSLEQMMTAKQRKVVFDAWMKAFEKAIKTNTDQKAQAYFEAVIAYINDPTEANFKAAAKLLPSRDLYQFISPSEYWAVNAEPLMRQQLGSAWDRFKMAVRRLFEGLKAVFGFDNTYYVHKVFAQVMGGSKERLDRKSINASLISSSGISFDTLRDLDDVQDLIDKYNRPKTPMIDQTPVKTFLVKQKEASKEFIQEAVQDPAGAINTLFDGMNRQLLNARNKNVWYGTAINAADTLRYNNSLRTSNDLATSSLALDNAIRGGHISAEVVFLGGLEFNDNSLMYTAVKRDLGMVGVYRAEKEIKDRLGDQLGTDLIQGYLEAKRSRSIENEFIFRANELEEMTARLDLAREDLASARKRKDQELVEALEKEVLARNEDVKQARADLDAIEIARGKINMSEEEIDEFISMDVDHPELRDILKNFNAVNQNLLRVWREVGLLSQARYEALSNIKDYVPWNRIMSDEDDLHSPVQATTRSRANIAKEKLFKKGKPTVITSFTTKEGEQVYRIQPTSTLQVTLNGEVLSPELYDAEVNGKVTINVPLQDGDDLVFEGNREIENIIDNMTRNVMRMTMNAVSKYAANTIVREYATRDAEGKIRTYPKPEQERGRFYFIVNGRRVVVEIKDPLLAEAIFGMRNVDLAMIKPLQAAANMTRRFITTDPMFQLFQLFKDAPLAGLISGVKNPFIVYANVFASFAKALVSPTVVAATKKLPGGPIEVAETMRILRAAGIGGYYQQSRTAEAEVKRRIGIMNNNVLSWVGKALDHIGDASDYAQRMAIYDRIMSETGDEALALYQAANVLNFLRHGSGQIAQILVKTVPFANAYANSTDVLFQAMAGGGLKGRSRKASIALFFSYGSLLAATTLLYVMLVGDDEEYLKLDDQTKLRHYIIPGTDIKLPMNTSAAFFFKALPEALYNAYINAATKDETDAKRLRTALKEAAADMLLGPETVPSALKPAIEIGLNRNFFTGRNVVPKNLEDVEAAEQYLGTTSEAGKFLSSLTGTDKTRLLNPIEADHIIRGLFGSVGAIVQWASNVLTDAAETKPTPEKKDLPMVGRLFLPEVARGHEEWFYNFKKDVDKVWNTYQLKVKREKYDEAEAYLEQNEETLKYHATVMMLSEQLQKINASIKYFETSVDKDLKPDERREEINEAKRLKQEVLEDIARIRKDHELEAEEAEKERKKAK